MAKGIDGIRSRGDIRHAVVVATLALALLFILWTASNAVLLIFAGILFGAFLSALAGLVDRVSGCGRGVGLAIVCLVLAVLFLGAVAWGGTALATQAGELTTTLREQLDQVLAWLQQRGIRISQDAATAAPPVGTAAARRSAETATFRSLLPDFQGLFGTAWNAVAVALEVIGDALVIIFLGIFFAAQPAVYRDALLLLVPPRRRPRVAGVLDEAGLTLRHWLLGQALTMSVIFLFVWLGLMLAGIGPAFVLGLQAGLLAFVPTLGPLLAGVPILLAGLAGGAWGVAAALAVYVAVQTLESYILTPMVQERAISVPPAFLFCNQILLGLLFGPYGLALATPLAAIARIFILRLYVEDALGDPPAAADGEARDRDP